MYKLGNPPSLSFDGKPCSVVRISDNAAIPFDEANTDFANFKKDLIEGAELQNAEGEVMTKADITEFMRSLP